MAIHGHHQEAGLAYIQEQTLLFGQVGYQVVAILEAVILAMEVQQEQLTN